MIETILLDVLKAAMKLEIANDYTSDESSVSISLPDGTTALITSVKIETPQFDDDIIINNDYVTKHDYGDIGEGISRKLLLRNIKDAEDYVNDVITSNIIDADFLNERLVIELSK